MEYSSLVPRVIYEDRSFFAVNKPAGLLVHGMASHHPVRSPSPSLQPTLVDWLRKRYPEVEGVGDEPALRPGIVHRLDKDTSGVMLVAKTQEYFDYLKSLFMSRRVRKTYRALVRGRVQDEKGIIDAPIGIKNGTVKRSIHSRKMSKEAVTEYRVLRHEERDGEPFTLLEVSPKTGRTHQIRVHLASRGHPVAGDPLYGGKKNPPWANRLMLHASSVGFEAKPGHMIVIDAEPPPLLR